MKRSVDDIFFNAWANVFEIAWDYGIEGDYWERRKHIAWLLWVSATTIKDIEEAKE